jgi:hypothetical protein
MFAIPPDATVHDVVPAVAAEADAVADAVPADQFEHAYMFCAGFSSSAAFGGSGIPVFGVHADKPTNIVTPDSFLSRTVGYTPVPDGAVNTSAGIGVVLAKPTGPPSPRRRPAQAAQV